MHKPMSTPPQKPILQPPLAPEVAQTETKRVSTILEINRLLLQEIIELQAAGRTGPVGQQGRNAASMENSSTEGKDSTGADSSNAAGEKQVSREYMEYGNQHFVRLLKILPNTDEIIDACADFNQILPTSP